MTVVGSDLAPLGEFVSRNWLFTLLIASNGWLLQKVISLHEKSAMLKSSETSTQKEIFKLEKENTDLKEHILRLEKTIKEKHSDEAVFTKYYIDQIIGIAVRNDSSKSVHCLTCLVQSPRRESPMVDGGDWWVCSFDRNHPCPDKPGRRRGPEVSAPGWDPYER